MSLGPFKIRNKIFLKNAAVDTYGVTLENDTITSANKTFRYPNADVTSFTGTGALVLGTSPSLTTPTLGAANATSLKPTTAAAFNFFLNDGSTNIGSYSTAGVWTLGGTTTNTYHLAQSSSSAHVMRFKNPTDNAAAYIGFSSNTALIGQIGFAAGGILEFYGGSAGTTYLGGSSAAGAWTLGPSGGTALHAINTAALTTSTAANVSYLQVVINGVTRRIPTYDNA